MIDDEDIVYRRVNSAWVKSWFPNFELGSVAFQNLDGDNMSGHLGSLLEANDLSPESLLESFEGYGLVWLSVKELRDEFGQEIVVHLDDESDPAHIHVVGKKSKGVKRRMAAAASSNVHTLPTKN